MFIPLRVHSVFSKGKGGLTPGEAASWAERAGLQAAALSDIDNLYGWAKWKRAAVAAGVTPIFGCETETAGQRLLLLVKTVEGYRNLVETLNRREIRALDGLVTIVIPQRPASGAEEGSAVSFVAGLPSNSDLFVGADFCNFPRALDAARALSRPLVWANPLKFVSSPERLILLRAIERKVPYPPEKEKLGAAAKLFGPDQEALAVRRFGAEAAGQAFRMTFEIAQKCRFAFDGIVPPLPADLFPETLREVVLARLRDAKGLGWSERQRACRELEAIEASGFAPYFLVVHDVVEFARRRGILHNLKGSGASSFLAYLLGISRVNPIEFDLFFERFLNSGRKDPPDIDLDFDSSRRDEVLAYVLEKYGKGSTGAAFVCSLKSFGARSALYETARAFGLPPDEARALTKRIPYFAEPEFLLRDRPAAGQLDIWKLASTLGGVYCEKSLHVGGVILTPAPAERYLPLEKSAKGYVMSHYDRDAVEDLRLIKLDLLSVRGLAAVAASCRKVGVSSIPAGDPKAYAVIREARTIGCFQVESPAMMNLLRRMKPENVQELTQALALIRPGPTESGMKEALLRRRERKPVPRNPFMERILPETAGLLLYEEQVMQVAERVAGMPAEEGDLLRRTLKKTKSGPSPLKEKFFREAGERGYAPEEIGTLWAAMEKFSSYSFNKAHSASYAAMAYQAVWLKAHHPLTYLTEVLNAGGGYYPLAEYVEEAKRCGIRILPPDVNRSGFRFEVEAGSIRVGLTSIKGLPLKTAEKIVGERQGGEYGSVEDFLARVKPGRADLLALIRAAAFDALEPRRTRQILRFFQGIEDMEAVSDLGEKEKDKMLLDALGFSPAGDPLDLFEGKRPGLRVRDLRDRVGTLAELLVRVVDARRKETNGGAKYFYLFEDETGLLEGVGGAKCLSFGDPPVCCLRGEVRRDGSGGIKIFNCSFLKSF